MKTAGISRPFLQLVTNWAHWFPIGPILYAPKVRSNAAGSKIMDGRAISIVAGLHRITGRGLMLLDVKTDQSRRRIPIPSATVDSLRAIKGQQIEQAELTIGQPWDAAGHVFAWSDGSPFDPDKVTGTSRHG